MDLRLNLSDWRRHMPDWRAAAVAGFAAGAVIMVLELAWVAMFAIEGPWRTSHLVAAIALGAQTAFTSEFNLWVVSVALLIHYALGIAFGLVLAMLVGLVHREGSVTSIEVIGLGLGALLYLVNFHGMTAWMPWFVEMRGWATFFAHLIFGFVVAVLYWGLRRPGPAD